MESYIKQGDCLELMKGIPDKSVDMILCDLPYGSTACEWDKVIDFEHLWKEYNRIIKVNGAIVLFAKEPFTSRLIISNLSAFKHKWTWNKKLSGSFHLAKYMPLQITEDITVFTSKGERVNYFPIMRQGKMRKRGGAKKKHSSMNDGLKYGYSSFSDKYYPTNLLEYTTNRSKLFHPTEKPVELLEYLIKTYTNEGEIVLDNCMGCGSTIIACIKTNRRYIGYELEKEYYEKAKERIEKTLCEKEQ